MTFEIGFVKQHFGGYYIYVAYWNNEQKVLIKLITNCHAELKY